MTAPTRPRTVEEQAFWDCHAEFCAHIWAPCRDCARGNCPTAMSLDEAADAAALAWGRKTGGWW